MTLRFPLLPLLALLLGVVPFAYADDSNTKAPPAEDGPMVEWPLPWESADARLVYDVRITGTRERPGVRYTVDGDWVLAVSSDPDQAPGRGQSWAVSDLRLDFSDQAPPEQRSLLTALARAPVDAALKVALDEDGAAAAITNLAPLAISFRETYNRSQDASIAAALGRIEDVSRRPAAEINMKGARQRMAIMLASDDVVMGLLMQLPAAYNFPGRGGVPADETLDYDDEGPNPMGGEPFPMLGSLRLSPPGADGADLEFLWELRLHPTRSPPIILALTEKVMGHSMPDEVRKEMPASVDISFTTRYRIDPATGAVRWMERTETRNLLGIAESTVTTFTLREPG